MPERQVRIVTYNTHGCVGTDRVHDPARIADVIVESGADVVALQELDRGRRRSGGSDHAADIACRLEMSYHFAAVREVDDGHYGNAVISRWPVRVVHAGVLPGTELGREPRGALWAAVDVPDVGELQVITTHLGLGVRERRRQVDALLLEPWLGRSPRATVVCGDLNAHPWGRTCRRLGTCLRRASSRRLRPDATFPSRSPILPIDHVFTSPDLEVVSVEVIATPLARRASDHLPLAVTLRLG